MLAAFAAMAGQQIASGIAQSRESEYNAKLYQQQAKVLDIQSGLETYQYNRAIRQASGKTVAAVAKSGLRLEGSPMAVLVDTMTQMELDKSIMQYNYKVEKGYAMAGSEQYKRQAKAQMIGGFTNAFSTMLQGYAYTHPYQAPKAPAKINTN